jgi:hypothetical protein
VYTYTLAHACRVVAHGLAATHAVPRSQPRLRHGPSSRSSAEVTGGPGCARAAMDTRVHATRIARYCHGGARGVMSAVSRLRSAAVHTACGWYRPLVTPTGKHHHNTLNSVHLKFVSLKLEHGRLVCCSAPPYRYDRPSTAGNASTAVSTRNGKFRRTHWRPPLCSTTSAPAAAAAACVAFPAWRHGTRAARG